MACGASLNTLNLALESGTVDEVYMSVDEHIRQCDIIFLCAPVEYNIEYLAKLKPLLKEGCILTDVGSTKREMHEAAHELGLDSYFIGGHPMAGSEKSGFAHSTDHLIENAWYVLTPTTETTEENLNKLKDIVGLLKGLCLVLDYKEHDRVVAAISHVPHLIAAALVNLVQDNDNSLEQMKLLAAGGFKDITRIASSSPVMWEQICTSNTEPIANMLQLYINSLKDILNEVKNKDGASINHLFERSRDYRNSIPDAKARGLIQKEYSLYCDIVDRAGAIATIATTLSTHQISMKNIGIIHNRTYEEGALKIEFYDKESLEKAVEILNKWNYTIYPRK
ncbi:Prephenate dehydrogenase [Lachnospiraceae bacterium TWA4]|nr:Prephenate dehydrogenase [Lachnospiraceae bacterium TWA4]